jgi:hypothetical protein
MWHRQLWLIDHGAALYFHHTWTNYIQRSRDAFTMIKDHVLLPSTSLPSLRDVDAKMTDRITPDIIGGIVKLIPDGWLTDESQVGDSLFDGTDEHRDAYVEYLLSRLESPHVFLEEAIRARSLSV